METISTQTTTPNNSTVNSGMLFESWIEYTGTLSWTNDDPYLSSWKSFLRAVHNHIDANTALSAVEQRIVEAGNVANRFKLQSQIRRAYRRVSPNADSITGHAMKSTIPSSCLSIREPDELIRMTFDDSDVLLADRLLARGQFLVIAGPAGIGKSRFVLQLAISSILGKAFLGLPVRNSGGRWLILQTENSSRRLQHDMARLKSSLASEEWEKVNANLRLHTQEQRHDYLLDLGDDDNLFRLKQTIRQIQPDVVVFDPLLSFAVGDLNTDADMAETCRTLQDLTLDGNPMRALIVIHHALTGRAGAARALGYDRSSFGRNSKVLFAWTRGQINLAPGSPDDNDALVVACGKNSNGQPFEPFGARLNTGTMLYEADPEFDVEQWEQDIRNRKGRSRKVDAETVAALLGAGPLAKADLVKVIMADEGCEKTTAYDAINKATDRTICRNEDGRYQPLDEK